MVDKRLTNNLRAELYKLLMPEIINQDQKSGVESYINFWDDPLLKWDEGALWDEVGLLPIIKNIFYAIEAEETTDLEYIDGITDLIDPDKAPERFLPLMAESLGHELEDGLSEQEQREVIKSIILLNKTRGRELSWEVFYRMIGWTINAVPLWKKDIYEANDQYHREQYITDSVQDEILGASGSSIYEGIFSQPPVRPGSIRIKVNGKVFRDQGDQILNNYGRLIAQDGSTGRFNYATGVYQLNIDGGATTNVLTDYETITEEFPYKAARVDLEFFIYLDEATDASSPSFNEEILNKLLARVEEVRPIHVILRLVVLVIDAPEKILDGANDGIKCGPKAGKDVRPDEYRMYLAEDGLAGTDSSFIIEENSGATSVITHKLDDTFGICPLKDVLEIERSDLPTPEYW